MRNHWIKRGIGIGIAAVAGAFLLGYVVMHLWNWLIPAIFTGAAVINYWQAFGILILSKILFGGFRGRHGCACLPDRQGCGHRGSHWRGRWWKEKWEGMSEEEKEKFRKRCGDWCEPEAKPKAE